MKIFIYTDPHIGLRNVANVTQVSAQRMRGKGFSHTKYLLDHVKPEGAMAFCLGDLFDQYSNDEATIWQAAELLKHPGITLAGNHDIANRSDRMSSLELLRDFSGDHVMVGAWGEPSVFQTAIGSTMFVFIPHVSSQELFEKAIEEAKTICTGSGKFNVLCLHCNYNSGFAANQDTSLNLTSDKAKELLSHFHHIFLGHEHVPAQHFDGRVAIIGNTFPTGFGDISDKRVLIYDTETGQYESVHTLSWSGLLWQGKLSELPEEVNCHFLDLEDDLPRGEAFKLVNKLYKLPTTFAIRLKSPEAAAKDKHVASIESMASMPEVVGKDLKENRKELLPLWEELLKEAQ